MAVERGQATVETAALWGLVALLLLLLAALLGPGLAGTIVARARRRRSPTPAHASRSTPDERALRNPRLRALIDRALPRLVLERDDTGDDDEVPVWTSCRHAACARAGQAPSPCCTCTSCTRRRARSSSSGRSTPTRRRATCPLAALRGYHRDDWEGLLVAFAPDGSLRGARASAHSGFNGAAPWWEQAADDWAPYAGVVYRASGSHALGFRRSDLDLAGDALERRPRDRRARRLPAASRPTASRCAASASTPRSHRRGTRPRGATPGTRHTSTAGAGPSRIAAAARVWAHAYALGAW